MRINGFDLGSLYVLDDTSNHLNLIASHQLPPELKHQVLSIAPETSLRQRIEQGVPIYGQFDDLYQLTPDTHPMALKASAIIPIFQQQKLLASFHLTSQTLIEIPPQTHQLLESVGTQICTIIQQTQNKNNLQRSMEAQSSLYELICLSLEKLSLDEFLNHVAAQIMSLTWMGNITNTLVYLRNSDDSVYQLKAAIGLTPEQQNQLNTSDFKNFQNLHADFLSQSIFNCRDEKIMTSLQFKKTRLFGLVP